MANGGIIGPINDPTKTDLLEAFTSPGTFTSPIGATTGDLLIVAGGGGSGSAQGGGGGAGGYRVLTCQSIPASGVTVTVGAGGALGNNPGATAAGAKGGNSSFGPLSSTGGAGGYQLLSPPGNTGAGGSGGGGSGNSPTATSPGGSGNQGSYSPPEGNNGGPSGTDAATYTNGGSGGGASGAGSGGAPGSYPFTGGTGTDATPSFGPVADNPSFYPPYPSPRAAEVGKFSGGGGGEANLVPGVSPGGAGGGGFGYGPSTADNNGITNTGGGGGSSSGGTFGNGASGFVGVKVANAGPVSAPGVWSMSTVYEKVKEGNWSN